MHFVLAEYAQKASATAHQRAGNLCYSCRIRCISIFGFRGYGIRAGVAVVAGVAVLYGLEVASPDRDGANETGQRHSHILNATT